MLNSGARRTDKGWRVNVDVAGCQCKGLLMYVLFSNVITHASEGDRISWKNTGVTTKPDCYHLTNKPMRREVKAEAEVEVEGQKAGGWLLKSGS